MFSELSPNGLITWSVHKQQSSTSYVEIAPQIHWNDLVGSLGSTGITEWQGWAIGDFIVNDDNVDVQIQCPGVHTVYIDSVGLHPVASDVYRRTQFWFTVNLNRGYHTIFIRLRAKGKQVFHCQLTQKKATIEANAPHFLPDIWNGYLFSQFLALPITNLQGTKWIKVTKVSVENQSNGAAITVKMFSSRPVVIAPGQTLPLILSLTADNPKISTACSDIQLDVKITTSDGGTLSQVVKLRCRKENESFVFTFIDHDGSVQHGAGTEMWSVEIHGRSIARL